MLRCQICYRLGEYYRYLRYLTIANKYMQTKPIEHTSIRERLATKSLSQNIRNHHPHVQLLFPIKVVGRKVLSIK